MTTRRRRSAEDRSDDAAQARRDIVDAAYLEFAEKGLSGASVNDIAARTRASKPMIYYYFGSKEGLYTAVMEEAYGRMRDVEQALRLDEMPPADAMRHLVETTYDYQAQNPDFVRLISIENIHLARHIASSKTLAPRNAAVIEMIARLLARGEQDGVFRPAADPLAVHLLICALCFYHVSNRHSWKVLFGRDLQAESHLVRHRRHVVEAVMRFLQPGSQDPS